jgi:hypothetical protein
LAKPVVDPAISYACNAQWVQVLEQSGITGPFTYEVISRTPAGPLPPSNSTGLFDLSGSSEAIFRITSQQGCVSDDYNMMFGCILTTNNIQLTAEKRQSTVKLNWRHTGPADIQNFIIQKSHDALHFTDLATLPFVPGNQVYSFDYSTGNMNGYYRIKSVKLNNGIVYSNIAAISLTRNGSPTSIFPNPVLTDAVLKITSVSKENIQIDIYDPQGKRISGLNTAVRTGVNNIRMDMTGLPDGYYIIRIAGSGSGVIGYNKILKRSR